MGSAISGCRRRVAHEGLDDFSEEIGNCSVTTSKPVREDILLACHNPAIHGHVYVIRRGAEEKRYTHELLLNPSYVDSEDDWNKYIGKRYFKYVWGINCQLNIPGTSSNIMKNAYTVLRTGGQLIFPIPVGFTVNEKLYPPGWEKMFTKNEIPYTEMYMWLDVQHDEPRASTFLVFTTLKARGGRRRKTMRKRGRRRTQKTKR
jgi:hypothetical protein